MSVCLSVYLYLSPSLFSPLTEDQNGQPYDDIEVEKKEEVERGKEGEEEEEGKERRRGSRREEE